MNQPLISESDHRRWLRTEIERHEADQRRIDRRLFHLRQELGRLNGWPESLAATKEAQTTTFTEAREFARGVPCG